MLQIDWLVVQKPWDGSKAGEDDLQIFISGDRVQLADKQHILWRFDICVWQITDLWDITENSRVNTSNQRWQSTWENVLSTAARNYTASSMSLD